MQKASYLKYLLGSPSSPLPWRASQWDLLTEAQQNQGVWDFQSHFAHRLTPFFLRPLLRKEYNSSAFYLSIKNHYSRRKTAWLFTSSHETEKPSPSPNARNGTSVLPFIITGATSKLICSSSPSYNTSILL